MLPNGMLVIQVVRQLTFNQQTQLIRLRGLVRPEDVNAQNQVMSTAITDMELEVAGQGNRERCDLSAESSGAVSRKDVGLLTGRDEGEQRNERAQ